jgi:hypothetical protein
MVEHAPDHAHEACVEGRLLDIRQIHDLLSGRAGSTVI